MISHEDSFILLSEKRKERDNEESDEIQIKRICNSLYSESDDAYDGDDEFDEAYQVTFVSEETDISFDDTDSDITIIYERPRCSTPYHFEYLLMNDKSEDEEDERDNSVIFLGKFVINDNPSSPSYGTLVPDEPYYLDDNLKLPIR